MKDDFGIYIQTYPGDYHLAAVLVRSIQQVSPDLPIAIIPSDDFTHDDHPFDVPIVPDPGGFWSELGHKDRSFWSFNGPFETFLFLDADILCTRSLDGLAERVRQQEGDFFLAQLWFDQEKWRAVLDDPEHPRHAEFKELVLTEIGRGPLDEFDPAHDFEAQFPFSTGIFASRRGLIGETELRELNEAERKFYREVMHQEWSWEAKELLFFDQGRMNYLVRKRQIPVFPLAPDLVSRVGADAIQVGFQEVEQGACEFHVLHWMGAKSPSPSFFNAGPLFRLYAFLWTAVGEEAGRWMHPGYAQLPEATGYSLWRHYQQELYGPPRLGTRLRWSARDARRTLKLLQRWLRIEARRRRARAG